MVSLGMTIATAAATERADEVEVVISANVVLVEFYH